MDHHSSSPGRRDETKEEENQNDAGLFEFDSRGSFSGSVPRIQVVIDM